MMTPNQTTRLSKFLSLVLRHQPDAAGITLDSAGWVAVDELLDGCARGGKPMTREQLDHVVATNEKKRFEFSADGLRVRASQGHSVEVELDYEPLTPPELLYHGTASRFGDSIRMGGLLKQARHHVHLSAEITTATQVGSRHGKPVVLTICAGEMHRAGHAFFRSTNGVWLVDAVPVEFIEHPNTL
jgi:putative RNA 2'-phosphotransferase